MIKEYLITIEGLVQGVCFRAFLQEQAKKSHLCGYAKNLTNGQVELCLQGDQKTIESFLNGLKQDSGRAIISSMSIKETSIQRLYSSFNIVR